MRALVRMSGRPGDAALLELDDPEVSAGRARVRVLAAGVCGTDVHLLDGEYPCTPPVVMGHEVTGVVDAVGPGGDPAFAGRRVALSTYDSTCGACRPCRAGRVNLCTDRRSIGSRADGGFAHWLTAPVDHLYEVPAHVQDSDGVLLEPLACVAHALLDPARTGPGDRVLVVGPGTMGQLAARVAAASGAGVVVHGLERDRDRLEVAARHGAEVSTSAPAPASFDVVVESSGSAGGLDVALAAARRGGHVVQLGIFGAPVTVDLDLVLYRELTLSSGFASTPTSWDRAVALVATRRVGLADLVTTRLPLDRWAEAVAAVRAGHGLKTVLLPGPPAR